MTADLNTDYVEIGKIKIFLGGFAIVLSEYVTDKYFSASLGETLRHI
jgi:hypothetical protein